MVIDIPSFVRDSRNKGMSDNAIKSVLLNMGVTLAEIDQAMNGAGSVATVISQPSPQVIKASENISANKTRTILIIVFAAILVLAAGVLVFTRASKSNVSRVIPDAANLPPTPTTTQATIENTASGSTSIAPIVDNTTSNTPAEPVVEVKKSEVLEISAMEQDTGIVYSTLKLSKPAGPAISVEIYSIAAAKMDEGFVGGFYYFVPPTTPLASDGNFLYPIEASITYTQNAVSTYKIMHPTFEETGLLLGYYDSSLKKYASMPSKFDPATRTVTGQLLKPYSGGFMILVPCPDISTYSTPDVDTCKARRL